MTRRVFICLARKALKPSCFLANYLSESIFVVFFSLFLFSSQTEVSLPT